MSKLRKKKSESGEAAMATAREANKK
eukprot:SAG11_NODE_16559_length_544_cov_0.719101_1_plen_25_part_10